MRGLKRAGIVAALTAATLVVTGCVPGGGAGDVLDRSLYMGAIPDPMPFESVLNGGVTMPEMPDMDTMPQMPDDPTDQAAMDAYLRAIEEWYSQIDTDALEDMANDPGLKQGAMADAEAFFKELEPIIVAAGAGGEEAVAAWQTLYVLSGVAVTSPDGGYVEIGDRSGAGVPVSDAELRLWAVQPAGGEMALVEVAAMLATTYSGEDREDELAEALFDGAFGAADQEFAMVFSMLGPEGQVMNGQEFVPLADIMLTMPQVNLLLRRLSAELELRFGAADQPSALGPESGLSIHTAALPMASTKPCEITDPWANTAVKVANAGFNAQVFSMAMEIMGEMPGFQNLINATEVGLALTAAVLSIGAIVLKVLSLQAEMDMPNAPLVRTKDRTPGEVRDLNVTMKFDTELWSAMRSCIALFLGSVGLGGAPGSGNAGGLGLDIRSEQPGRLVIGDGTGANATGLGVNRAQTDKDGKATFKLSGAPYKMKLPETSEPEETKVQIRLDSNIQSNDFYGDMVDMLTGLLSAGMGTVVEGFLQSVQRMRLISFTKTIDVTDWLVYAEFDVTLSGQVKGYRSSNTVYSMYADCGGGLHYSTSSTDGVGSVEADDPVRVQAVLLTNPDNSFDQIPVFSPLGVDFADLLVTEDGVQQFALDSRFSVDKQYSNPGVGPLPELEDGGVMGCGDGSPDGYVPPVPDCGTKKFSNELTVNYRDSKFLIVGERLDESPWEHCSGTLPMAEGLVPVGADSCGNMSRTNGGPPSVDDVFDQEKTLLEATGTIECSVIKPGSMRTYEFTWTMEFCRIIDGKRAC